MDRAAGAPNYDSKGKIVLPEIVNERQVDAEVVAHILPDAATAAVQITTPIGIFVGMGASKRHPKDEPDTEVASSLAMARAFDHLAAQLHEYARERIQ